MKPCQDQGSEGPLHAQGGRAYLCVHDQSSDERLITPPDLQSSLHFDTEARISTFLRLLHTTSHCCHGSAERRNHSSRRLKHKHAFDTRTAAKASHCSPRTSAPSRYHTFVPRAPLSRRAYLPLGLASGTHANTVEGTKISHHRRVRGILYSGVSPL